MRIFPLLSPVLLVIDCLLLQYSFMPMAPLPQLLGSGSGLLTQVEPITSPSLPRPLVIGPEMDATKPMNPFTGTCGL